MLNAVNAILAIVHRSGWDDSLMAQAHNYLERVRRMDASNGKYQKLAQAYRQVVEKNSKQHWSPPAPEAAASAEVVPEPAAPPTVS